MWDDDGLISAAKIPFFPRRCCSIHSTLRKRSSLRHIRAAKETCRHLPQTIHRPLLHATSAAPAPWNHDDTVRVGEDTVQQCHHRRDSVRRWPLWGGSEIACACHSSYDELRGCSRWTDAADAGRPEEEARSCTAESANRGVPCQVPETALGASSILDALRRSVLCRLSRGMRLPPSPFRRRYIVVRRLLSPSPCPPSFTWLAPRYPIRLAFRALAHHASFALMNPIQTLTSQPGTSFMISLSLATAATFLLCASLSCSANMSGTRCILDHAFSLCSSLHTSKSAQLRHSREKNRAYRFSKLPCPTR